MTLKNTLHHYGSVAKFFHWTIALLIIGLLALGFAVTFMDDMPIQEPLINIHKLFGLLVLTLAALRLLWLLYNPRPPMLEGMAAWERIGAHLVHGLLYLFMFLMPITGWVMSMAAGHTPNFLGIKFPLWGIPTDKALSHQFFTIHKYSAWALIIVLVVHVGAALKHHFLAKDKVLKRMLPNRFVRN
jgi:cytochrome b561